MSTANRVGGARRKSVSNNAANIAAVAAAAGITDPNDKSVTYPIDIGNRRASKSGGPRPDVSAWGPAASLPVNRFVNAAEKAEPSESAVDDQESGSLEEEGDAAQKARARRASDGQSLAKEGRKFNRPEIHCQHCGKGYKHSSCLTKHLFVPLSSPSPFNDTIYSAAGWPILGTTFCYTKLRGTQFVDLSLLQMGTHS